MVSWRQTAGLQSITVNSDSFLIFFFLNDTQQTFPDNFYISDFSDFFPPEVYFIFYFQVRFHSQDSSFQCYHYYYSIIILWHYCLDGVMWKQRKQFSWVMVASHRFASLENAAHVLFGSFMLRTYLGSGIRFNKRLGLVPHTLKNKAFSVHLNGP